MLAGIALIVAGAWLVGQALVGNLAARLLDFARNPPAGDAGTNGTTSSSGGGGGGGGTTVQ